MDRRGPPADADRRGLGGAVAVRARAADRVERAEQAVLSSTGTRSGWIAGLDFHSLRRSYVTHLIEDGWDPLFVQQQAGHEHASTTSIYTCVSSDFRTRTLRRALDATVAAAMRPGRRSRDGGHTAGQLPVAAAGGHGRRRAVQRHRPGAAAGRAGHHACPSVQVWRLVTQTPERLSLPVLAALCDIFEVTPAQLIATRARERPGRSRRRPAAAARTASPT